MKSGTVLFDSKFQFPNGKIDYKLIIVACEMGEDYLVFQTTRQPEHKNTVLGCQKDDRVPNFFIPTGTSWFKDDTWVLLNEAFSYSGLILAHKKADGIVEHKNQLNNQLIKAILDCARNSSDIDGFDKEFIEKAYDAL
jgi:hypothetical protein